VNSASLIAWGSDPQNPPRLSHRADDTSWK
jgi:hypothetical protein